MKTTRRMILLGAAGVAAAGQAARAGPAGPAAGPETAPAASLSELLAMGRSALARSEKDD